MDRVKTTKTIEGSIDLRALTEYIAEQIAAGAMLSMERRESLRTLIEEKERL